MPIPSLVSSLTLIAIGALEEGLAGAAFSAAFSVLYRANLTYFFRNGNMIMLFMIKLQFLTSNMFCVKVVATRLSPK